MAMTQLEIYLLDPDMVDAIAWLSMRLGNIKCLDDDDGIQVLGADSGAGITVTPGIDNGPFTSILVAGLDLPWADALECCRDASHVTNVVARSAPQDQGERDLWIQVAGGEESVVVWDDLPLT